MICCGNSDYLLNLKIGVKARLFNWDLLDKRWIRVCINGTQSNNWEWNSSGKIVWAISNFN